MTDPFAARGTPPMTSGRAPLKKFKPWPNNPRIHPDAEIELLAKVIALRGPDQPIVVDEDFVILKGHGRLKAAELSELKDFPFVQRFGLSESEKLAIRIEDNSIPLLATWSTDLLSSQLIKLKTDSYDMGLFGFSDVQLVSFLANVPTGRDPEATPEPPTNPVSKLGDLWQLGKHRILCGDSTKKEDVARVLGKHEPYLMVTDPPYGVGYDPTWSDGGSKMKRAKNGASPGKALGKVINDDRVDWREAWMLFSGNVAYCWHDALHAPEVDVSFRDAGFQVCSQIIWSKRMIISRGDYHWAHEPCWYLVRKGKNHNWQGDRKQTTVWEIGHSANDTGHSTQKPVECMKRPIENNSQPGDYVYDPFCGSGTTIIAAEMTVRYCLAIELNPAFIDVAVRRWQDFAKREATLAEDGRTFAQVEQARKKGPRRGSGRAGLVSQPSLRG